MASDWQTLTLAELSTLVSYGYTESASSEKIGPRFLRITDIQGGKVTWSNVPYCSISHEDHLKYRLCDGDIVIARTGNSTGENFLYQGDEDAVFASYLIRFRIDPKKADPKFVWYNLRSKRWWDFINNSKTGSAQAGANAQVLGRFSISCPSLSEQRSVAYILGKLDDKIELNRQTNETLEAMARALFEAWFVDFEPVRAKMDGRWKRGHSLPGLSAHLYDLFPDRLVHSELGEIPEGWQVATIDELCESITSGGTPARKNSNFWANASIPWFKTGELNDSPLLDSEEKITETALRNSSCKLWPIGTVLFAIYASPTVGRIGVLAVPGTSNQAAAGLIAKKKYGVPFLVRALVHERVNLQNIAVGAAQQNINLGILKSHLIVIPPENLANKYSKLVESYDEKKVVLMKQCRALASLRDALLPKIISGDMRIAKTDDFV